MQIKVKNIRTIEGHLGGKKPFDKWGDVSVVEAKLVLIECKPEEALFYQQQQNIYHGQISHYSFSTGLVKGIGKYLKPILISEIEKIEVGDRYVHGNIKASNHRIAQCKDQKEADNLNKLKELMEQPKFPQQVITNKILALPEHFSSQQLQDIVDGKLKDGDKVLIECGRVMNPICDVKNHIEGCKCQEYSFIKLNSSNHITLHKVEEKMYTKEEMRTHFMKFIWKFTDIHLEDIDKYFKENIK